MAVTLLLTFVVIWLVQGGLATAGLRPRQSASPSEGGGVAVAFASPSPLSSTETPTPSLTPAVPPEPGAMLIDLPSARIAFASDHAGDHKDRIYVYEVQPGQHWLTPLSGIQYQLSQPKPGQPDLDGPILGPLAVPVDETQERAWWPEWCDGNRSLLFEGGDRQSESFQTIYTTAYNAAETGAPRPLSWSDFPMLGVPRCANRSSLALASASLDGESGNWQLHSFNLHEPDDPNLVGDGFLPFGGYASFSGDDSWLVLMHKEKATDQAYRLLQFKWSDPRETVDLPLAQGVYSAMYPSISPLTGEVAYACELQPETTRELGSWGLCLQDVNGQSFRVLEQLGLTTGLRQGFNRFHVFTPRWSADGRWIAYASPKDGDWDIYLYLVEKDIEFNLTQALTGDQFHPSWSKP